MLKLAVAAAAAALAFAAPAAAQNIVQNPSFETNTAWNIVSFSYNDDAARTGIFSMATGCAGSSCTSTYDSGAYFEQVLTTVAGQTYDLSFYVAETGPATSAFSIFWNGLLVNATTNPANSTLSGFNGNTFSTQTWQLFSFFDLLAPTVSTELQIHGRHDPNGIYFDNISVTPTSIQAGVPEPATWAMMLLGFGGIGVSLRRRRPATIKAIA